MTKALTARAMLRADEGKLAAAWQDLLACHRLARLVGRDAVPWVAYYGMIMDHYTSYADLAFLDRARLTPRETHDCLNDLLALPVLPPLADAIDLGHRFWILDTVMQVNRRGLGYLDTLTFHGDREPRIFVDRPLNINMDPALSNANLWLDRVVASMRLKDRRVRQKELNRLKQELKALKKDLGVFEDLGLDVDFEKLDELLRNQRTDTAVSKTIGDVLIGLQLLFDIYPDLIDRHEQDRRNVLVAFALSAYRGDHGAYPKTLSAGPRLSGPDSRRCLLRQSADLPSHREGLLALQCRSQREGRGRIWVRGPSTRGRHRGSHAVAGIETEVITAGHHPGELCIPESASHSTCLVRLT